MNGLELKGTVEHIDKENGFIKFKTEAQSISVNTGPANNNAQTLAIGDEITIHGEWGGELNPKTAMPPVFVAREIYLFTSN